MHEWVEPWIRASRDRNQVHITRNFLRSIKTHSDDRCLSQVRLIQGALSSTAKSLSHIKTALDEELQTLEAERIPQIAPPFWWRSSIIAEDFTGIKELRAHIEAYERCDSILQEALSRISETKSEPKFLVRQSIQLAGLFDKVASKPSPDFQTGFPRLLGTQIQTLAGLLHGLEPLRSTSSFQSARARLEESIDLESRKSDQ